MDSEQCMMAESQMAFKYDTPIEQWASPGKDNIIIGFGYILHAANSVVKFILLTIDSF